MLQRSGREAKKTVAISSIYARHQDSTDSASARYQDSTDSASVRY